MKRLVIVPRWAGRPDSDFYPWLRGALAEREPRPFEEVVSPAMPAPEQPTVEAWSGRVSEVLGRDPALIARTALLGHSVGCRAALHALAALPPGVTVAGALLVAAWWTVDKPWESILPWIAAPLDLERVRAACPRLVVLLSTNDPFTSDFEVNRRAWEERLGASVHIVPDALHFNKAEEPAVLSALLEQLASRADRPHT